MANKVPDNAPGTRGEQQPSLIHVLSVIWLHGLPRCDLTGCGMPECITTRLEL